jgi:hypothetical protein
MEKRHQELYELRDRARWALEHAEHQEPCEAVQRLHVLLRLWHYPAFDLHTSWTVFQTQGSSRETAQLSIRQVVWDNIRDSQRLTDPMEGLRRGFHTHPTLRICDAAVGFDEYNDIVATGRHLAIPMVGVEESVGLDGETFGIEIEEFLTHRRLEWWCSGPEEWRPFTKWVASLRSFLQRCVEDTIGGR